MVVVAVGGGACLDVGVVVVEGGLEGLDDFGDQRAGGEAGALGVEGGEGVGEGFALGGSEEGEEVRKGNAEFGGDLGEGEGGGEEVGEAGLVEEEGGGWRGCGDHASTGNVRQTHAMSIGMCLVLCKWLGGW